MIPNVSLLVAHRPASRRFREDSSAERLLRALSESVRNIEGISEWSCGRHGSQYPNFPSDPFQARCCEPNDLLDENGLVSESSSGMATIPLGWVVAYTPKCSVRYPQAGGVELSGSQGENGLNAVGPHLETAFPFRVTWGLRMLVNVRIGVS